MSGERNKACKRDAKKNCRTKFRDPKINPKQDWKTINDILGRNNNKNTVARDVPGGKSILIIKINAQHNALSKAIKTRFKIEIIYCDVSS